MWPWMMRSVLSGARGETPLESYDTSNARGLGQGQQLFGARRRVLRLLHCAARNGTTSTRPRVWSAGTCPYFAHPIQGSGQDCGLKTDGARGAVLVEGVSADADLVVTAGQTEGAGVNVPAGE